MVRARDDLSLGHFKLEPGAMHVPVEVASKPLGRLVQMDRYRWSAPGCLDLLGARIPVSP